MLLPALLLAPALLLPPQETTPQQAPPAATAPTEATPAEGSVEAFLKSVDASFFDPTEAGLHQLEYVVPITLPAWVLDSAAQQAGVDGPGTEGDLRLGSVDVSWTPEGDPTLVPHENLELPDDVRQLASQVGATTESFPNAGRQSLDFSLNRTLKLIPLLEAFSGSLEEGDDGQVTLRLAPRADVPEMQGEPDRVWTFDADHRPLGFTVDLVQQGPMGPMPVSVAMAYEWQDVDDQGLLLTRVSFSQEMGEQTFSDETAFRHGWVGGLPVLTGYTETIDRAGEQLVLDTDLEQLVVNGELVAPNLDEPAEEG